MKRRAKTTEDVNKKYAMALKEVYQRTKNGLEIRSIVIADKYAIASGFISSLQRLKIIKPNGEQGHYIWNLPGEPNIKLANTVRSEINKHIYKPKETPAEFYPPCKSLVKYDLPEIKENTRPETKEPDIRKMIAEEIAKAMRKPEKKRKILKFRNPFYWITK